ncbi:dynein, partial [Reticulomyxa filosa]
MVETVMQYLAKNYMARSTYITPRHYLDLIRHFVKLFDEKRQHLDELQRHLSVGLKILHETEEEVEKRQLDLNEKETQLSEQQQIADEKLHQMMHSEQEATKSREEAIRVEEEISKEMAVITEETRKVEAELAQAKPALELARQSVSNIKKSQLDEIRAMRSPPERVKLTLQAVFILLNWKIDANDPTGMIKAVANKEFIQSILGFDTNAITDKQRSRVNKYLENPDLQYELVNKSSQACGPMILWVQSQVKFASLLNEVEPMRAKIESLKTALATKEEQATHLKHVVVKLEADIKEYKAEYAKMVQRITELKHEMTQVQQSMARAKQLLQDLSQEKHRWSEATTSFERQRNTLVGDCLISAAFLTYIGYYNITYRQVLIQKWKHILHCNNVPYDDQMELLSYLSTPGERLEWKCASLPDDDLCMENAVLLKRFNRYPLLVDPSGQAIAFLLSFHKQRKIVRTSFLDSAFLNNLENGLRFGNALVIEDVENFNPIVNPILNKEIQTVGGRNLIRLVNKDVDFSPTFTMFLSQCLSLILRHEAPDIDEQRNDQLRLQGEFKFQLRELENQLLDALNAIHGNILDDEHVMTTLENLKHKAKAIQEKADQSEHILQKIEEASRFYSPFARACTRLYFCWEALSSIHFLYQFDLSAFMHIVHHVLQAGESLPEFQDCDMKENKQKDNKEKENRQWRLLPLLKALHRLFYIRTKRSLLVKDHLTLAFRIAQIYIDCHPDSQQMTLNQELLLYLLKNRGYKEGKPANDHVCKALELTSIGASLLGNLSMLAGFDSFPHEVETHLQQWITYRNGPLDAPIPIPIPTSDIRNITTTCIHGQLLEQLAIQKIFRPDQMMRTVRLFVESVFDTPLLMASTPGNDPSNKIDALATDYFSSKVKTCYEVFAMGSPDDYAKADNAITAATKKGTWVLLKNVHLSPQWLQGLEKRLHRMKKHQDFRLFMTMEIHPKVPVTLLRKSLILINEPPLGIKASLQRTFHQLSSSRVERAPRERGRLYVLLAWLHAMVLERLRFEPIGWSKAFEFSETDKSCAMDALDEWIDRLAQGRDNVDPNNEIPWDALQKMLVQFIYGGRVDNEFDTNRLTSF